MSRNCTNMMSNCCRPTASKVAPLVLLEAMACGLPFVANGVAGIRDYTNPDCRITSGDMDEYLPALASMAEALYAGEIDHARLQRYYSDTFSFTALCDRWETFLREIIALLTCGGGWYRSVRKG